MVDGFTNTGHCILKRISFLLLFIKILVLSRSCLACYVNLLIYLGVLLGCFRYFALFEPIDYLQDTYYLVNDSMRLDFGQKLVFCKVLV